MAGGKLVWFGARDAPLLNFLDQCGHPVPQHANVADFVLTLINADFEAAGVVTADVPVLVAAFAQLQGQPAVLDMDLDDDAESAAAGMKARAEKVPAPKRAPWATRFLVLCGRDFKEVARDPGILGVRLAMYTMLAGLIALMFLGLGDDLEDGDIVARVSVLFYVAAFMVFMSVAVLPFFVMQRPVFVRERCNGAYDVRFAFCLAPPPTHPSLPFLLALSKVF